MSWCEAQRVDYLLGLARNTRLQRAIGASMQQANEQHQQTGRSARVFQELSYCTRKTWSATRRVVAKAEVLPGKTNPRFVVTSLSVRDWDARTLYEDLYCARGEMENRIKECQLDLFADRTSTATFRANQLRLWLSSFAYVLIEALRRLALQHTDLARATVGSIRLKLLKIGAVITLSVRRVKVAMSSAFPLQALFHQAFHALSAAAR
jgi:hypothetical protein